MRKPQTVPFGLRMPDEVKEWALRRAKEDDRSVNSTIVRILKEHMKNESEAA